MWRGYIDFTTGWVIYRTGSGDKDLEWTKGLLESYRPRLYKVPLKGRFKSGIRVGAVYFDETKHANGRKTSQYWIGVRRCKRGELWYLEAEDWNGHFGANGRRLSLGPRPKKKDAGGQDQKDTVLMGRWVDYEGRLTNDGDLLIPELKNPYRDDEWEEGQDFSDKFQDHTEEIGGPEKAQAKYKILIGKGPGEFYPGVVGELSGLMTWGTNRKRRLKSIMGALQLLSQEAKLLGVAAVRGIKASSEELKISIGRSMRRKT